MDSLLHTVATQIPVAPQRDAIRRLLMQRQRELSNEIQRTIRNVREEGAERHHRVTDLNETTEVDPEDDLAFALLQMKAQLLNRINEAVRHVDEGTYGYCVDCDEPFRWIGVPIGLSPRQPMVSVDETELRAPLRPASSDPDFGLGLPGFAVRMA